MPVGSGTRGYINTVITAMPIHADLWVPRRSSLTRLRTSSKQIAFFTGNHTPMSMTVVAPPTRYWLTIDLIDHWTMWQGCIALCLTTNCYIIVPPGIVACISISSTCSYYLVNPYSLSLNYNFFPIFSRVDFPVKYCFRDIIPSAKLLDMYYHDRLLEPVRLTFNFRGL